jgi:hypothetical protein
MPIRDLETRRQYHREWYAKRKATKPLYITWNNMMNRVRNPRHDSYHRYGGRGVEVAPQWRTFEGFQADNDNRPSSDHSFDRWPDPCGDYEPGNVRWATREEQARNRCTLPPGYRLAAAAARRLYRLTRGGQEDGLPLAKAA